MRVYAENNNGVTPVSDWSNALSLKDRDRLTCPTVSANSNRSGGYALNLSVSGILLRDLKDPARTVAFFETDALGPSIVANLAARDLDRHEGRSNVAYVDMHARSVSEAENP